MAATQVVQQVAAPQFRSNDDLTPALLAASDIRELQAEQKVSGLNELFSHYYTFVFRICSKITESGSDAEDAAQETFLRAHRSIHQFQGYGNSMFSTWLGRIAINCALTIKTRKKKVDALSVALRDTDGDLPDWLSNFEAEELNPEQQAISAELGKILKRIIQGLPPEFRTVFVLRDVEGLSTVEAAETLDLSQPALKSRLGRGRQMLRERMAKYIH